MAEDQDLSVSAAVAYPRKILEYMEGFLISKVMHTQTWVHFRGETCVKADRFEGKRLKRLDRNFHSPV